ncbi:MAG: methyltransferase domain-containing protein [Deltaproteobacteria bacterium]|nr:methyltransferase domain-containing protein [Deltaproteobacteria bacterium]
MPPSKKFKKSECRFCKTPLTDTFCNLGLSPLSNSYLTKEQLNKTESVYPLHTYVCKNCLLVQLEEFETPEAIFSDYAYFSSYSESWLQHAKKYVESITKRFGLNNHSQVIEIASNDGYLLQYFKQRSIPVLGIEPAANIARVAQEKGINTWVKFFGTQTAQELTVDGKQADLVLGNNVLAHVPSLNDFVEGVRIVLKKTGLFTFEFPHLLQLINQNQFDTIYHEHFSYFSFLTVQKIFAAHNLVLFDVEELPTHGGSLRIYGTHKENKERPPTEGVAALRAKEIKAGLDHLEAYLNFENKVKQVKDNLLLFLTQIKKQGKTIVGYGAPAKGNTLLNFCEIKTDFIDYTVDRSPHKQGLFLPGTHIPIFHPDKIKETHPDYLVILPWNLKEEIVQQQSHIRQWGGQFVIPIPQVEIIA